MSDEFNFEAMPFEAYETVAPEQSGFELEEEFGRRTPRGRPGFSPRSPQVMPKRWPPTLGRGRPKPTPVPPPGLPPGRPKWPRPPGGAVAGPYPILTEPYGAVPEPYPAEPLPGGSEYMRWVQSALNDVLGLRLPVNGVADPATRSAIRSFQQRNGLPADGLDCVDRCLQLLRAPGEERDRRALPRESRRDRAPRPLARPGDQNDFAVKLRHDVIPLRSSRRSRYKN